ncbi:adenylate/guanylate cyclase domain-containing protein [Shivajiella indica]|uniref:Adenylate/guanylate cyclase domain-containing protein n=1 Tax=Shivajiella indica TaxID=872115 RepID=A0ABW5BDM1_9BACT
MENGVKRNFSAIMFSDIVGYSSLMGSNEDIAFQLVKKNTKLHEKIIEKYHGIIVKELGDGVLCSFENSRDAVLAALDLQEYYLESKELSLRIGIHCGEVIVEEHDVFGDAVNIASRIQALGNPGSILFSGTVASRIHPEVNLHKVSLGKFKLKNIKEPMEVFALCNRGLNVPKRGEILKLLESRLKKLMIAGLIFLSIFLGGLWAYYDTYVNQLLGGNEKSIAVLPFKNLNQYENEDYFIEGLTEDIITQLSKISELKVISKTSTNEYKKSSEPIKSIAKSLGVQFILIGSIQKIENRIKIRTQLIDVERNKNLWAESYDKYLMDIFQVQSEIAQVIAEKMSIVLTEDEILQLDKKPTENFSAYDIYLKGRDFYQKYEADFNKRAIIEFKKSLEIDPEFALAWAGLGDAYSQNYGRFGMERFWIDSSLMASKKALDLDSNLSEAYKALAVAYNYIGDYEKSQEYNRIALSINPNNAQAMGNLGSVLMVMGRLDQALIWEKKAAGLNPKSFIPYQIVGWNYRLLGENDQALKWLKRSLEIRTFKDTYEQMAYSYISMGECEEALSLISPLLELGEDEKIYEIAGIISLFCGKEKDAKYYLKKSVDINPDIGTDIFANSPIYLGYILYKEGNFLEAEVWLEGAYTKHLNEEISGTQDEEHAFNLASIYAIRGDYHNSMKYLKISKEKHWLDLVMATHNPIFQPMNNNPEFKMLTEKIIKEVEIMRLNVKE